MGFFLQHGEIFVVMNTYIGLGDLPNLVFGFSLSHMCFQLTWGRKFSICFTSKVVAMSQSLLI